MDAFAVMLRPANSLCITCVAPVYSPASKVVGAGNPITITFTVTNQGPDLATNVTVGGQLSTNISATFTSASGGSGSICSPADRHDRGLPYPCSAIRFDRDRRICCNPDHGREWFGYGHRHQQ
jgi:uncharacterized repeat protein (TIGR01451 family)